MSARSLGAPLALAALSILIVARGLAGCNGDIPAEPTCSRVPDGGCPSSFGDPCGDPTCAASYACTEQGWAFVKTCPLHEAGADGNTDDVSDAGPALRDVDIDVPGAFGGPGCQDLQAPDCPLAIAAACGTGCCGCQDLFVCQGGGWVDWGVCGDGGVITPR